MGYSSFHGESVQSERVQQILKEQHDRRGDGMGAYKRACWQCSKEFYAMRPESRYCSYRCTNDSYISKRKKLREISRQKVCGQCGVEFQARRNDAKYCSTACKQAAYRKRNVTDIG